MDDVVTDDVLILEGVEILHQEGWSKPHAVVIRGGVIEEIRSRPTSANQFIDAHGLKLLPGIIDIHGDGFEYHITPRAGVNFPIDMAIMANDMVLIASGITTFFYSITDGFEPGMRNRETVRNLLHALEQHCHSMKANVQIHIRHEQANTLDHDELINWIKSGRIDLLSLNNHLPSVGDDKAFARYLAGFKRRVSGDTDKVIAMIQEYQHRLPTGERQVKELVALAEECGVCLASHDDMSDEEVKQSLAFGVQIAEFPMSIELATQFREKGVHVLMGAPNAVRGKSHVSAIGAREAIQIGAVDMLCSDYYYPSLYRAPFLLNELNILDFPQAWRLVSANPAEAVGLGNRKGKIEEGMDADLLLISTMTGFSSDIKAVISRGQFALNTGLHVR